MGMYQTRELMPLSPKKKEVIAIVEFKSPEHFNTKDKKIMPFCKKLRLPKN